MDNTVRVANTVDNYDVVVLAGGAGRRLGGVDKAMLSVGGRTLLERVLAATAGAAQRIVVGPTRPGFERPVLDSGDSGDSGDSVDKVDSVVWTREDPPGSGPLAALAAGIGHGDAPVVLVLAVDLPFFDTATCRHLVAAVRTCDAAVLVDAHGQRQPLAAAYRRSALRKTLARIGDPTGRPVRLVLDDLELTELPATRAALDVDTPTDVESTMLLSWTQLLAEALEVDGELADLDLDPILDLARDAAHGVERPAAPVTTFLVGYAAARRGAGPELIADLVRQASELARAQNG